MKKSFPLFLLGLILGVAGAWLALRHHGVTAAAAASEEKSGPDLSTGNAEAEKQLAGTGITVAVPQPVTLAPEADGFGRVLDAGPLVALAADAAGAHAAAEASAKELARVQTLHDHGENASTQAVEAAEAAMRHDQAQFMGAQARLTAGWGPAAAGRTDLAELIHALARGDAALVRLDLPAGEAPAMVPPQARVGALTGSGATHEVEVLGPAPAADAQAQDSSYLALWRDHPLPVGTALRAVLPAPGQPEKLLMVPRSALVRHDGSTFIYAKTAQGGYERRIVEIAQTLPDGVALASGVGAQDQVVVTGAQQLLSTELLGATGGGGDEN